MTRTIFAYASFFSFSVFSVVSLLGFYSFKIKSLPRVRLPRFCLFPKNFRYRFVKILHVLGMRACLFA